MSNPDDEYSPVTFLDPETFAGGMGSPRAAGSNAGVEETRGGGNFAGLRSGFTATTEEP